MNQADVLKQIVHLLNTRAYHPAEFEMFANALNYLVSEIQKHEPAEATDDTGTQG